MEVASRGSHLLNAGQHQRFPCCAVNSLQGDRYVWVKDKNKLTPRKTKISKHFSPFWDSHRDHFSKILAKIFNSSLQNLRPFWRNQISFFLIFEPFERLSRLEKDTLLLAYRRPTKKLGRFSTSWARKNVPKSL